jgi:hypothetical protein
MMASMSLVRLLVRGAAAGAAGTTALNAATYLDMALRGRPASSTPSRTVEHLATRLGVSVPGTGDQRSNRVSGLGSLSGLLTGVAFGAVLASVRRAGIAHGPVVGGLVAATGAIVGANAPMAAMKITDPRDWSAADWIADLVPHLAYGLVTGWVLDRLDRREQWPASQCRS